MFSLQETISKAEKQLKEIRNYMDANASFHPDDANLYRGLGPADQHEIKETLRAVSLGQLIEYLGRGSTIGNYLVATKVHDDLIAYTSASDLVPKIGQVASNWEGGDLDIDIVNPETYRAGYFSSGGILQSETVETKKATITPISFGVAPRIAEDLIEDANFDLVSFHLKLAAQSMARLSNDMALTVMQAGADGWGTLNTSVTGDADFTRWTSGTTSDCRRAILEVGRDKWIANTMVVTQEAWNDQISITGNALDIPGLTTQPPTAGFDLRIQTLDVIFCNAECLHLSTDAVGTFTNCITLIFDRDNALFTGRKRWMKMENYAEPVKDLAGMVVSARQDSVTLHNDAIFNLYET